MNSVEYKFNLERKNGQYTIQTGGHTARISLSNLHLICKKASFDSNWTIQFNP